MGKLKKTDYESDTAKQLKNQYDKQLYEDRELELAKNLISRIPENRQFYVLKLLSEKFATKKL